MSENKSKFEQFVNDVSVGKEFLNEGVVPTKSIAMMVKQPMYTLNQIKPNMESLAMAMGKDYSDNIADDKDFMNTYKNVCIAYEDAKMAYVMTLNKALKQIK